MSDFKKIDGDVKLIFGVCSGLAYALGIKTWIVRLIAVVLFLGSLSSVGILYFLCGILMPSWESTPENYKEVCE